jgi:hypothetical protein
VVKQGQGMGIREWGIERQSTLSNFLGWFRNTAYKIVRIVEWYKAEAIPYSLFPVLGSQFSVLGSLPFRLL